MSSGHHHPHKLTPAELDDLLDEALANPKIQARLKRPYTLLTGFDIALLGSSAIGGENVYLDRHLRMSPSRPLGIIPVGKRRLNTVTGLIRHERLEQALEDVLGWPYLPLAHPVAQHFEERDYVQKGFDPQEVEKAFAAYIKKDALERIERTPTDLDQRPLLALKEGKIIARVNETAQKEKRTHESVGYIDKSSRSGQRCAKCARFIAGEFGGPSCVGVRSPIEAGGWCRRFVAGVLGEKPE